MLTCVQDKLAKLADDLRKQNLNLAVTYRAVDIGNYEQVDAAIESAVREQGEIDILINNVSLKYRSTQTTLLVTIRCSPTGRSSTRRTKPLPTPQDQ